MIGLLPGPFAETLRRAHCAHSAAGEPTHVCVGRCTITRDKVELDCKLCGSDHQSLGPSVIEAMPARAVVEAVGMSWDSLTPEAQRAAVSALERARR